MSVCMYVCMFALCRDVTAQLTREFGVIFAALNMANAYVFGGGYVEGMVAQEENMFRRTDCHFSDAHFDRTRDQYHADFTDLLEGRDGRVYLDASRPRVCIRRSENRTRPDLGYELLDRDDIFPFFELRAAAQDLRRGQPFDPSECSKRIVAQLDTLRAAGLRHAVLSAFGCGAFMNPASQVARCYHDAISQRLDSFDVIAFAVFDAGYGPRDNFDAFERAMKPLVEAATSSCVSSPVAVHAAVDGALIVLQQLHNIVLFQSDDGRWGLPGGRCSSDPPPGWPQFRSLEATAVGGYDATAARSDALHRCAAKALFEATRGVVLVDPAAFKACESVGAYRDVQTAAGFRRVFYLTIQESDFRTSLFFAARIRTGLSGDIASAVCRVPAEDFFSPVAKKLETVRQVSGRQDVYGALSVASDLSEHVVSALTVSPPFLPVYYSPCFGGYERIMASQLQVLHAAVDPDAVRVVDVFDDLYGSSREEAHNLSVQYFLTALK